MDNIIFFLRKNGSVQLRQIFAQIRIAFDFSTQNLEKLVIHPYYFSVIQKYRIRNCQLLQKCILYNSILRGKFHQLFHQHGSCIHIQNHHHDNIQKYECRHYKPGFAVHPVDPDIHAHQQYPKNSRPLHICTKLSFYSNFLFLFHNFSTSSKRLQF